MKLWISEMGRNSWLGLWAGGAIDGGDFSQFVRGAAARYVFKDDDGLP